MNTEPTKVEEARDVRDPASVAGYRVRVAARCVASIGTPHGLPLSRETDRGYPQVPAASAGTTE